MRSRRFSYARLALAFALLAVALSPFLTVVRAPPPLPFNTWGQARDSGGGFLPLGTPVRTFIDGVEYSNLSAVYDGAGSFSTDTFGNFAVPATPELKEGGNLGDAIMYVSGTLADAAPGAVFQENATWQTGSFLNRDLNEASSQPALLKIQSVTLRPGDLGTQYAYICNPTANPVDASVYYVRQNDPGTYLGPRVTLAGTVRAGGRLYVDLSASGWMTATGDALKLVWTNPGGVGVPNGGADVIIDRVEFNATSGGTLFWEPGNTVMTNAVAPGLGQEIRRTLSCADTNAGSDFTLTSETGRPAAPVVDVTYPNGGERLTGGSIHPIDWNMTDADPDNALIVNVAYSTDGGATYPNPIATGLTRLTDPSSTTWPVPVIESTLARVQVCARDLTDLTGCDASAANFVIDSTAPQVQSTDPVDTAIDVPLNRIVTIAFNEDMQPTGSVSFVPAVGALTYTWVNAQTVQVGHRQFAGCTAYTLNIGSTFLDASRPGNPLVPTSTTFTSICAPTVVFGTPAGGEVFSGGSSQSVTWFMDDAQVNPQLTTWVNLSTDSGVSYPIPIDGPTLRTEGNVNVPWNVNTVNTTQARVQVCVANDVGLVTCDSSPADFAIDSTAPTIVSTSPADGANDVLPDDPIVITFSEPMNVTSVVITASPSPGGIVWQWDPTNEVVSTLAHNPFAAATTTVTVATSSADASNPGNAIGSDFVFSFDLDTPPTVAIATPAGAECWGGNSVQTIAWTMDDVESGPGSLVVYINYTTATGTGTIASALTGLTGSEWLSWTTPPIDDATVRVVITVIDPRGLPTSATSAPFAIDSTAPVLLSTQPLNGAQGVSLTQPIVFTFSEAMDPVATTSAIAISPSVAGFWFSSTGPVVTIRHGGLAPATAYTVTVSTFARDACSPGNPMASARLFSFVTGPNTDPAVSLTSPAVAATWNVGEVHTIAWLMSDSETPPADLVVWLNYTSSSGAGTLVNGQAGTTSFAWTVPTDLAGQTVTFRLEVLDTAGGKGAAASPTMSLVRGPQVGPDVLPFILAAVVIAVAVAGLLVLFLAGRRKREEPEPAKPVRAPAAPRPPAVAPPPPTPPAAAPATKKCPSCGTIVDAKDPECFMCGRAL